MSVPEALAIPLSGGCIFATITLVVSSEILWRSGITFDIFHDSKRQTVLNGLMFLAGINGIIAYPYNATGSSLWVTNITTIFSFAFVQWGLVIVNHNSIERFNVWSSYLSKEQLRYVCGFLYFLPFIAMIPVYYAAADKMPGARLNSSGYNAKYFKPETLALIITTEVLATISDFFLLYTVFQTKNELLRDMSNSAKMKKNIDAISADLLVSYGMTWVFLAVDIVVKILIIQGYPFLFDSIISLATIALRARTNITFGLNLKDIFQVESTSSPKKSGNSEGMGSKKHLGSKSAKLNSVPGEDAVSQIGF